MTLTLSVTRLSSLDTFWSSDKRNVHSIPKRNLFRDYIAKSIKSAAYLRMDTISSFPSGGSRLIFSFFILYSQTLLHNPIFPIRFCELSVLSFKQTSTLPTALCSPFSSLFSAKLFKRCVCFHSLHLFTFNLFNNFLWSRSVWVLNSLFYHYLSSSVTAKLLNPTDPLVCILLGFPTVVTLIQPFFLTQWLSLAFMTQVVYQPPPWPLSYHFFMDHPCLHSQ